MRQCQSINQPADAAGRIQFAQLAAYTFIDCGGEITPRRFRRS